MLGRFPERLYKLSKGLRRRIRWCLLMRLIRLGGGLMGILRARFWRCWIRSRILGFWTISGFLLSPSFLSFLYVILMNVLVE